MTGEHVKSLSQQILCIHHILDGLRDGLSHFSLPSRVALLYAVHRDDPLRVYDPQNLLEGHEPKLKELYLDNDNWRHPRPNDFRLITGELTSPESLQLAGLISYGVRSRSVYYQMWFTEHHPDMCSIGPTERWMEHAAWLLSQDLGTDAPCMGSSGIVLQAYAIHAVRDHIVDERNMMLGPDTLLRVYPILDAVLGVSKTREEGAWPRGKLIFVDPERLDALPFLARFPKWEQPSLSNHKHVRKLLQAVESGQRALASEGTTIVGIVSTAKDNLPATRIVADFHGGHGFIRLGGTLVCSFSDGNFHSTTRRAKLVQLEELLLDSSLEPTACHSLFQAVSTIVHNAEECKHGCTLVIDMRQDPTPLSGQYLVTPLNLCDPDMLDVAQSLAHMDGALHLAGDCTLRGFACLLDGLAVPGENRARGARFNSALRFTAAHEDIAVVVVSADRPVSIIHGGIELTAQCAWKPMQGRSKAPLTLSEWLIEANR